MKLKKMMRDFAVELQAEQQDENILSFSCASETPYVRKDKKGKEYSEVLLINDSSVDFTRLVDGRAPLLLQHDDDNQIGVVERAWIEDGKLWVTVRFSRSTFAQEILQDIKDGIRRNVSIGYVIDDFTMKSTDMTTMPVMEATKFTIYEVSIVAAPADVTVGIGRELDIEEECKADEEEETKKDEDDPNEKAADCTDEEQKDTDNNEENPEDNPDEADKADDEAAEEKADESEEIKELGKITGEEDEAEKCITEHKSLAEFKELLKKKKENLNVKETTMTKQKFSLRKVLLNQLGQLPDEECTFEREIIAENKRKFNNTNPKEIVLDKRAFDGTEALNQPDYQPGMYAPVLRAPSTKDAIGTRKVAVTGRDISFPIATSGIAAGYTTLNGNVPSATMDFELKTMQPHKIGAYVDISYTSLTQDDPSAESVILDDIVKATSQAEDAAFWSGLSGNNEPVGLLNTANVNEVTLPATPTLSTALEFEKKIRESNDYSGDLKWVFGTEAYYKWSSTPYSATEQNKMLIDDQTRKCIGYDCFVNHSIPTSSVILGNFNEALEADFDGMTIRIVGDGDRDLAIKQALTVVAHKANDYCFRRPKSFTKGV